MGRIILVPAIVWAIVSSQMEIAFAISSPGVAMPSTLLAAVQHDE
jgi:hypothetical protein